MFMLISFGGMMLLMVLIFVANGAIAYGVFQSLTGKTVTLGDCVRIGIQRLLPVIGVAIVTGFVVLIGYLMLFVPGIIFYVMFCTAVPVAVVDRPGYTLAALSALAARRYRSSQVPERRARSLPEMSAPAWTFLHGPRVGLSSTELRKKRRHRPSS